MKSGLISCWNEKQNTKSYLPANKYRGLRGYKASYLFLYPLGFFIIRMARHYFPLLSVNLQSVKPVLNPKEIWEHQFQLGFLEDRALGRVPLVQQI